MGKKIVFLSLATILAALVMETFCALGTVVTQKAFYALPNHQPCEGFAPSAFAILGNIGFLYKDRSESLYFKKGTMLNPLLYPHHYISAVGRDGHEGYGRVWINEAGFVKNNSDTNDEERLLPGDLVVLVTGGSTTAGYGSLRNEDTFPSQLERWLGDYAAKSHRRLRGRVRVVNGGAPGYGSVHELLLFAGKASLLRPKPLAWIQFDGINEPRALPDTTTLGDIFPDPGGSAFSYNPIATGSRYFPAMQSFFFVWGPRLLWNLLPAHIVPARMLVKPAADRYVAAINRSHAIAEGMGVRHFVFLQPNSNTDERTMAPEERRYVERQSPACLQRYGSSLRTYYAALRPALEQASPRVPWFDLSGAFRGRGGDLYFDGNHYTREGNGILAEQLGTRLVSELKKELFL